MLVSLPHVLLAIAALLVVVSAIQPLARKLVVSDAVLLALVGVLIGGGATMLLETEYTDAFNDAAATVTHLPVNSQAFLLIFLPLLVFHGALSINVRRLARDATPVLLLAIGGVLVTTVAIGYALWPVAGVPLTVCLLLGAIVATTDPSAVVSVFRDIGADSRLTRLVEGESLLNDATAISIFTVLLEQVTEDKPASLVQTGLMFLGSFLGALAVGFVLARLVLAAISWLAGIRVAEVTLTLALPYVAYIAGEEFLGVSGVIAAAAAGLTISAIGPSTFRPQGWTFLNDVWAQLSFLASSLVFVLASMLVPRLLLGMHAWDLVLVGVVVLASAAARAAVLFGLLPLLVLLRLSEPVPSRFKATILWGGLRGAITLALALSVTENHAVATEIQRFVAILATGFVLFTLLVNGTTLRFLVGFLGLDQLGPIDQALRHQVVAIGLGEVRDRIKEVAAEFGFSHPAANQVLDLYARRIKAETEANTYDTVVGDRERVRLGLISFASRERSVLLDLFRERAISRPIMENLLWTAESMIDGARTGGRTGYMRAARRRLRPTFRFRVAQWLHRTFRYDRELMRCMMERYETLLLMHLLSVALMRFMRRRMEPVLGTRVAEVVKEIAGRRQALLADAMEALRIQYPGYAEALENRMLRQIGVRLEAQEYMQLRDESLIGEELYDELMRALEERRDQVARPLRFNLQLGLDSRIKRFPLFTGLREAVLHELTMNLTMRFTVPGEVIYRAGRVAESVFFISSGGVRVQAGDRETMLVSGDFFGETEILEGGRRRARVTAARFSHLLELRAADFRQLLAESPELLERITALAAQRERDGDVETDASAPRVGAELSPSRMIEFDGVRAPLPAKPPADG